MGKTAPSGSYWQSSKWRISWRHWWRNSSNQHVQCFPSKWLTENETRGCIRAPSSPNRPDYIKPFASKSICHRHFGNKIAWIPLSNHHAKINSHPFFFFVLHGSHWSLCENGMARNSAHSVKNTYTAFIWVRFTRIFYEFVLVLINTGCFLRKKDMKVALTLHAEETNSSRKQMCDNWSNKRASPPKRSSANLFASGNARRPSRLQ